MKRVGIIDYGLGNIHSVQNAFRRIGAEPTVVCDAAGVEEAHHLVLPGVGAFAEGMRGLRERGLFDAIRSHAARERPLLGICLGMQLLLDGSEEFGSHEGLGIISGRVRLIDAGVKVPHVGWARLQRATEDAWDGTLLAGTSVDSYTYFVHSYHAVPSSSAENLAQVDYGPHSLCAAVRRGPVVGTQFHP